jgi:hypothetical protein
MRLAPKPSQANANAVASRSGTYHSDSEDLGGELEAANYDSKFATKPFDEAFISASQKTPPPSRVNQLPAPGRTLRHCLLRRLSAHGTCTPSAHRLLADLGEHTERVQPEADEQAAPKAPTPPVAATPAAVVPPAAPAALPRLPFQCIRLRLLSQHHLFHHLRPYKPYQPRRTTRRRSNSNARSQSCS